jgi:hypothetical protein
MNFTQTFTFIIALITEACLSKNEMSDCACFEVFTAVTMKNAIFWDAEPCGSCKSPGFGVTYHLHHQGDKNQWARNSVPPNRRFLQEPHGVTSQKTVFSRCQTLFNTSAAYMGLMTEELALSCIVSADLKERMLTALFCPSGLISVRFIWVYMVTFLWYVIVLPCSLLQADAAPTCKPVIPLHY